MKTYQTSRGFDRADFKDANEQECSIQQSSAIGASDDAADYPGSSMLWLGTEEGRMHLTREMVSELTVLMCQWLKTGHLE